MKVTTKKTSCQILDRHTGEFLAQGLATIKLLIPDDQGEYPRFRTVVEIMAYPPELDRKIHTLKINDNLSGEVFMSISGIPSRNKTTFSIIFQDPVWLSLDWFNSLPG